MRGLFLLPVVWVCASCAVHKNVVHDDRGEVEGVVYDARLGTPIAGARVALCENRSEGREAIRDPFGRCDAELESTSTGSTGSFRLTWSSLSARVDSRVIVTATGYLPWVVPSSQLSTTRSARTRVVLRSAPTVEVKVVNADGRPIALAGAGWFRESKDGREGRYEACCTDKDGIMSFVLDGVLEGELTIFTVASDPLPRFGTAIVRTTSGNQYTSVVRTDRPLKRVFGRVVDASGQPLAALVAVEPLADAGFSTVDRILLEAQGAETDMEGRFTRYLTTSARAFLELRTWTGLRDGTPHVVTEKLSAIETQFNEHPNEITLRAPAKPIVHCTIVGPNGNPAALSALGVSFSPHRNGGHSGSCFWVGGPLSADASSQSIAREVRFVWPGEAGTLLVIGHSEASAGVPSSIGEIALEHPEEHCHIRGK
jgi:hypothetical protein